MNSTILLTTYYVLLLTWGCNATLIASSKVRLCGRDDATVEPKQLDNKKCNKKFVVTLVVENGRVSLFLQH